MIGVDEARTLGGAVAVAIDQAGKRGHEITRQAFKPAGWGGYDATCGRCGADVQIDETDEDQWSVAGAALELGCRS